RCERQLFNQFLVRIRMLCRRRLQQAPARRFHRDFLAGACEIQLSMDRYRRGAANGDLGYKSLEVPRGDLKLILMRWNVYEMEYTVPIRGCFSLVAGKRVLQDHVGAGNASTRRVKHGPLYSSGCPCHLFIRSVRALE